MMTELTRLRAYDRLKELERLNDGLRFEANSYHKEMMIRQARIEKLEAALREIVNSSLAIAQIKLREIARAALEGK